MPDGLEAAREKDVAVAAWMYAVNHMPVDDGFFEEIMDKAFKAGVEWAEARASESALAIQHIAALKHHNKECAVCKELNKLMSQHMKPETRDNPNDVSRAKEQSNEAAERSYGH